MSINSVFMFPNVLFISLNSIFISQNFLLSYWSTSGSLFVVLNL